MRGQIAFCRAATETRTASSTVLQRRRQCAKFEAGSPPTDPVSARNRHAASSSITPLTVIYYYRLCDTLRCTRTGDRVLFSKYEFFNKTLFRERRRASCFLIYLFPFFRITLEVGETKLRRFLTEFRRNLFH